jgi:5'-3' exonuclease
LNTLDIDHGALEHIFTYYKEVLPSLDDYITYHGKIDFKRAEKIFKKLASHELNNLTLMLKKVTSQCDERDQKKRKAKDDKINLLNRKKINAKKENFLVKIKQNDEAFIVNFKKSKITGKINGYKEKYHKEKNNRGHKNYKFEDEFKVFQKDEIQRGIKNITEKSSEPSDIIDSESNTESESKKLITNNTKKLTGLFISDDEAEPDIEDQLTKILREVSKYDKYINDENYCSDINIDDIDDGDVSKVSDIEEHLHDIVDNEEYTEHQDMDKVFQSKLVEYYVKDVGKAKRFYYKEKLGIDLETQSGQDEHKNMFRKYMEGLQWVLYYYYRGVKSWRWFYPYHYPPMISDFEKIKEYLDYDIDKCFVETPPYSPLQSLLFILPSTSRDLIPRCYWSIYDEFPEYFPRKFNIDFNGKKMPWEALVLIPFVPEEPILEFEERQRKQFSENVSEELKLTERDLLRNNHGKSYMVFNQAGIINKTEYRIYREETVTNLISNYETKTVAYNFPSLKSVVYDYNFESKKNWKNPRDPNKIKTITIKLLQINLTEDMVKQFIRNAIVFINYPFKYEAIIRGIFYNNQYYYLDNRGTVSIDYKFKPSNEIKELIRRDWQKKGIPIESRVLVHVSTFKRIARNCDGTLVRIYDDQKQFYVPFETTSLNTHTTDFVNILKDYDVLRMKYSNINSEFENGNCILLCKMNYGFVGIVEDIVTNIHSNYGRLNNENYTKLYDSKANYDLQKKDWDIELHKLYNGPLVQIKLETEYQTSFVTEPNFAKNVIFELILDFQVY